MIALDLEAVPNAEAIKSRQWAEYKEKKGITDDQEAALHPAFAQVVCVCAYKPDTKAILSVCSDDEYQILRETKLFLNDCNDPILGGHNIKGYDIPMLGNRMLANNLEIPSQLQVAGKQPWKIPHIDTVELLKFGGGPYLSLDAICLMLGIPSPKEGSVNALGVWDAFREMRFSDILKYCGQDVNQWIKVYTRCFQLGAKKCQD